VSTQPRAEPDFDPEAAARVKTFFAYDAAAVSPGERPMSDPPNLTGIPEAHAKATQSVAELGTVVVSEGANLARYVGRLLGTGPEDVVGLVLGDPLRFVRTAIAGQN
jgi:hypothetical protein